MNRKDIRTRLQDSTPFFPNMLNNGAVEICLKEDVDKYIDEMEVINKEEKYKLKSEIESLKVRLEEEYKKNEKLKDESSKHKVDSEKVMATLKDVQNNLSLIQGTIQKSLM